MDTGGLLRQARDRAGLGQAELARAAGTSAAAVCRYETGRVSPTVATLSRLLAACGTQVRGELEPLGADLDAVLDRPVLPVGERLARAVSWWGPVGDLLRALAAAGVPVALGGEAAAALHGLPLQPAVLELLVPDEDRRLEVLGTALLNGRGHPLDHALAPHCDDPAWFRARPTTQWDVARSARLAVRPVAPARLERRVEVLVPTAPEDGDEPPLRVPVLPLDALLDTDPTTARLVRRALERSGWVAPRERRPPAS